MGLGIAKRGLGLLGKIGKKKRSEYRLKNALKRIQKMPDKKFKSYNPAKETRKSRHGFVHEVHKTDPVKGRIGKKTYKGHWKRYHHHDHPKGKK